MKKTNYISRTVYHVLMVLPLLALTRLTACSEDETTFPDYEKDWFQLEDSSDPAQHAAGILHHRHTTACGCLRK